MLLNFFLEIERGLNLLLVACVTGRRYESRVNNYLELEARMAEDY